MADELKDKSRKRRLTGAVVSDKMAKTRIVEISRFKKHPKYLKYYKVTKRFKAHDEKGEYHVGNQVVIEETKPLSKEKRWRITGFAQKSESKSG